MKRNKKRYLTGVLLLILATFIYREAQPYEVVSSSVFSSSDLTETRLYVIMNTLLPAEEAAFAKNVISDYQKINGPRGKASYELRLYRTEVHYILHKEYAYLFCDASGNLLPRPTAGTDLLHSARSAPSLLSEKPV